MLRRHGVAIFATPQKAAEGMRVQIEYTGTFDDGEVFSSTDGGKPLEFMIGEEDILPALEAAVLGLAVGESREVKHGEDAPIFGLRSEDQILKVPLEQLPEGVRVGSELKMEEDGPPVVVIEVNDKEATIDTNHPLAGRAITISVKLVHVEEVPASERLVVETVTPGDGKTYPEPGDQLTMHYVGTLASTGEPFDASERDDPFEFQIGVGQVIPGWDKGVMKMSLGEKAILRIPSAMGYGARGAGDDIPPNADLVFEVELLSIN